MPKAANLAAQSELAHQKALAVVEDHGDQERVERLRAITVPMATTRHPQHLVALQAELIAALAEIAEGQTRTIADLESRIVALEATPAAAEKPGPAKKVGKKA